MPTGFFTLRVKEIQQETHDAVSIQFEVPASIKGTFQYTAGQYITIHQEINNEEVRRSYSVCSSPILDESLTVAVKRVEDGRMSTFLTKELSIGSELAVMPPLGKFTMIPDATRKTNYVLIAGGSGITPVLSILKTILTAEPLSSVTLLYANRDEHNVIFKNEIENWASKYASQFSLNYSYDNAPANWEGLSGILTTEKIADLVRAKLGFNYPTATYFICGPAPLMELAKTTLQSIGVRDELIHTEYFTAVKKDVEQALAQPQTVQTEELEDLKDRKITIEVYGRTSEINIKAKQTILEAAQDAGLDPPYSCTVGVCTTCRAKVLSGKASMDEREGLSDAEIAEGYVLTCQAHPRSEGVKVVFE